VIPDDINDAKNDEAVGLSEDPPTKDEAPYVSAGWFRGLRGPVVFVIKCVDCSHVSRWYRSIHPRIILHPNKWGRLCGEQEDLRLNLASYIGVRVRTIIPLDWDHVWSEYCDDENNDGGGKWKAHDGNERNFAVRLDEGIGAWTGVLAVSATDPQMCDDVTNEYLAIESKGGGRVDHEHANSMPRYRTVVAEACDDEKGQSTQASTLNGHVLHKADMFVDNNIRSTMQNAAKEYGKQSWWQVNLA